MYAPDPIFIRRDFSPSEYDIKLLRSVRKYSKQTGMVTDAYIKKHFGVQAEEELATLRAHGYLSNPPDSDPWKSYDSKYWSLTNRGLICLDNAGIIERKMRLSYIAGIVSGVIIETVALILAGWLQIS